MRAFLDILRRRRSPSPEKVSGARALRVLFSRYSFCRWVESLKKSSGMAVRRLEARSRLVRDQRPESAASPITEIRLPRRLSSAIPGDRFSSDARKLEIWRGKTKLNQIP